MRNRKRYVDPRKGPGFVYFIRCEQYVKIGHSQEPRYRCVSFATTNPFPCEVIGLLVGSQKLERELQSRFRQHHHQYEWFHYTPDVEREIAAICGEWQHLAKPLYWYRPSPLLRFTDPSENNNGLQSDHANSE